MFADDQRNRIPPSVRATMQEQVDAMRKKLPLGAVNTYRKKSWFEFYCLQPIYFTQFFADAAIRFVQMQESANNNEGHAW